MIDQLREAFPHIDWHEKPFDDMPVTGALNEKYMIAIFPFLNGERYQAQLRGAGVLHWRWNYDGDFRSDPVEAVKSLQSRISEQESVFDIFHTRFEKETS